MKKLMRWLFVGLLLSAFSCRKTEDVSMVFRYNESSGIFTLDPAFAKDLPHIWACNQLYNGLVQLDSQLNVKPSLAKYWTISEDGLVYTFVLRPHVQFHAHPAFGEGKRFFVASDVVYSLNRLVAPEVASPGRWIMNQVARSEGKLMVYALNDSTLQIRLQRPFPGFLSLLSMAYASVVPFEVVEAEGANFRKAPVGTGPFQFQLWEEGVRLVLRKNPHYFETDGSRQLPLLEAVSISFLTDKQTAFMEFIKGRLDFMSGIDVRYKDELLTRQGILKSKYSKQLRLIREPFLNTEYLGFFVGEGSMPQLSKEQFKAMRKAVSYGIDRDKMLKYLRNNIGTVAHGGMIPKGLAGYDHQQNIGYSFNPDKAAQLISQYNLRGKGFTISVTADYVDLVKYIQSQLNQLGLLVEIEVMPTGTLRDLRAQGKLQVFRASWVADYPDAENYLSLFYSLNKSPSGPNYTHFADPGFDLAFERIYEISDPGERALAYRQLDSMMMQEAPVTLLYYDEVLRFIQNDLQGFSGNPTSQLDLRRVWKKGPM